MKDVQTKITAYKLSTCSPREAYEWLAERYQSESEDYSENEFLEYVLLRRKNEFINLGLAKYATSTKTIERIFNQNNRIINIALFQNKNAVLASGHFNFSVSINDFLDQYPSSKGIIQSIFSNEKIDHYLIRKAINQQGEFAQISDDMLIDILLGISKNPNIGKPYDGPMDGDAETGHSFMHGDLLRLALEVPVSYEFAEVISKIIDKYEEVDFYIGSEYDIAKITNRWEDTHKWEYFGFRKKLGVKLGLGDPESEDEALRHAFYETCAPEKIFGKKIDDETFYRCISDLRNTDRDNLVFGPIRDFYDKDGEEFFYAFCRNENFWRGEQEREILSHTAWSIIEDPHHDMSAPNFFNSQEAYWLNKKPHYFEINAGKEGEEEPLDEKIKYLIRNYSEKIEYEILPQFLREVKNSSMDLIEQGKKNAEKINALDHNFSETKISIAEVFNYIKKPKFFRKIFINFREYSSVYFDLFCWSICFVIAISVSTSMGLGDGEPYLLRWFFHDVTRSLGGALGGALEAITPTVSYARETHEIYETNLLNFTWRNTTLNQLMFIFCFSFNFWKLVFGLRNFLGNPWNRIVETICLTLMIITMLYSLWLTLLVGDWIYSGSVLIIHYIFS